MSQPPPLSPEQEQQAVDAITALDWTDNYAAARHAVTRVLGITDQEAESIVAKLSDRRIIRMVMRANNFAETGSVVRSSAKWNRAGIATTLELIRQLTTLEGYITLESSRAAVSQSCGCSIGEANHLLHELRDRNILTLMGEGLAIGTDRRNDDISVGESREDWDLIVLLWQIRNGLAGHRSSIHQKKPPLVEAE